MGRKIIKSLVSFIVLIIPLWVFSNTNIDLYIDNETVSLWDRFALRVNFETSSTWAIQIVELPGIENFVQLWQQSSNSTNIINGQISRWYNLSFLLSANKIWEFEIWPIKGLVWNQELLSDVVTIKVDNWVAAVTQNNVQQQNTSVHNTPNKKTETQNDTDQENTSQQKKEDNDIRPIKTPNNIFSNFMLFQLIIIFLLIWLFFYYKFVVDIKEEKSVEKIVTSESRKSKIKRKLRKLKKDRITENKSIFYELLNWYFRDYFQYLWITESDILTLKELKDTDLDKELLTLFEKSYYCEFNDIKDSEKDRIDMIDRLLNIIK